MSRPGTRLRQIKRNSLHQLLESSKNGLKFQYGERTLPSQIGQTNVNFADLDFQEKTVRTRLVPIAAQCRVWSNRVTLANVVKGPKTEVAQR